MAPLYFILCLSNATLTNDEDVRMQQTEGRLFSNTFKFDKTKGPTVTETSLSSLRI